VSYREIEPSSEPQRLTVEAPVTSVTVLEDRAVVTRTLEVVLSSSQLVLTLEGVSPVVVDKSLTVTAAGPVEIVDAGVTRAPVVDPRDVPRVVRELDDRIETLRARVDVQRAVVDRLSRRVVQLRAVLAAYLREVVVDGAIGREATDVEGELRAAGDSLRDTVRAAHDASALVSRTVDDLRVEERLRAELEPPTARHSAKIHVVVTTASALPVTATLTIRVTVANACWRPRHRAELRCDEAQPLVIHAMGTVWQNTGEDWSQVELACSTERPSLGSREPELSADVLAVTRRAPLVVETREEAISELGGAPRRTDGPPGIDDGGTPARLVALGKVDLPSNGRPYHVELFSFASDFTEDLVLFPELGLTSSRRVELSNQASRPLLAGPVELVLEGEIVGTTTIDFVAPSERFKIGFGPHPSLAVHREVVPLSDRTSFLGSWVTRVHDVRVLLSNLGKEPLSFTVVERVAVSEIEKVKISVLPEESTDRVSPDAHGFVRWTVTLGPYGRRALSLRVSDKRASEVA
jgi:uncharacterized protein (TIGR02231 family)